MANQQQQQPWHRTLAVLTSGAAVLVIIVFVIARWLLRPSLSHALGGNVRHTTSRMLTRARRGVKVRLRPKSFTAVEVEASGWDLNDAALAAAADIAPAPAAQSTIWRSDACEDR